MTQSRHFQSPGGTGVLDQPTAEPCLLVIFGASGDLTKRLLMPAFYNLVCDGLLSANFAIVGTAMDELTTESFREKMSVDIKQFSTRAEFDQKKWESLCSRLYYTPGKFDDADAFAKLAELRSEEHTSELQ